MLVTLWFFGPFRIFFSFRGKLQILYSKTTSRNSSLSLLVQSVYNVDHKGITCCSFCSVDLRYSLISFEFIHFSWSVWFRTIWVLIHLLQNTTYCNFRLCNIIATCYCAFFFSCGLFATIVLYFAFLLLMIFQSKNLLHKIAH